MLKELAQQFHPLRKGNKTKSGVYLILLGMAAELAGIDAKAFQADIIGIAGAVLTLTGLAHDFIEKVKLAKKQA